MFFCVLFVVLSPPPFLSSLLVLGDVALVVGLCQFPACFVLLKLAFSQLAALLLFVSADSLTLSAFLVVLFQSVLVLDALFRAVSKSAYFLGAVLFLLSILAAVVVSVGGCVLALLLFPHSLVSAVPSSSSLPFFLAVWFASFLDIRTDISPVVV